MARPWYVLSFAALLAAVAAGCSGSARAAPPPATSAGATTPTPATTLPATTLPATTVPPATTTTTTPATTTTRATTTTVRPARAGSPPPFSASVQPVTAAELGATWHPGCPVGPDQLKQIRLTYWGFDAAPHQGTIVVGASVVGEVERVFATLYAERFPIREMVPEAAYGGNDNAAAAADDTSGFNCRYAVAPGPPQWSVHAFGEAIDVNDVENPYFDGATVIPPAGAAYRTRADVRPGMAEPGGALVEAFAAVGWQWGGRWTASPDYQHFSATGG